MGAGLITILYQRFRQGNTGHLKSFWESIMMLPQICGRWHA